MLKRLLLVVGVLLLLALAGSNPSGLIAAASTPSSVSIVVGTGIPGLSDQQVNNPYGLVIGPDKCLYFCDVDSQRVRRLDLKTKKITTIAGTGERAYRGDGGRATDAALNMPHELRFDRSGNLYIDERDNHVVRKVDAKTGIISTVAGTGVAGFSGDGGPGVRATLRQPHSIEFARDGSLLICDLGNNRIRRLDLVTGVIETIAGTGETKATPDNAPLAGAPLNAPRTIAVAPDGDLYVALREGNAIYRIDNRALTIHRVAGTGEQGYSGDGGPALQATLRGPKGLAYSGDHELFVADTENHVIRRIDLATGIITTVLGDGTRGDGPQPDPLRYRLSRPHGVYADAAGLYITNSEAHRILLLR